MPYTKICPSLKTEATIKIQPLVITCKLLTGIRLNFTGLLGLMIKSVFYTSCHECQWLTKLMAELVSHDGMKGNDTEGEAGYYAKRKMDSR